VSIGQRIKAAREQAGITQVELGEKIGVSGVAIMRYEKGTRQPRLEQLQAIAAALGVSVNFFLPPDEWEDSALTFTVSLEELKSDLEQRTRNRNSPRARVNSAMDHLPEEGQEKVATYAEDLLPRYRAQQAPQSPPAPTEGMDTTPPPDGSEGPGNGE